MPAKPVSIGSLHFERKGDAADFFRDMLYKYDLGDKVTDSDAEILSELVAMHPEAEEKIGCGIASFSVRSADFGTRCFWVNRTDGSTIKFSFKACF
ncbi:DCL family protein [Frigidibacter oleivorans]|uniref:DCL family protein n=1 Tax=Frigidibacter oleivorans TaxID=2487129 RepID=UPI000F8D93CB|nr:DCL family protein [Frigidibacter oleivorans]